MSALAIDIGGTLTDIVLYDDTTGRFVAHKELTTPADPAKGVVAGIQHLFTREGAEAARVTRVVHATTLFTNALIERRGAPTGLITTAGFRDTLEIGHERKYELYDLHLPLPQPLVRRALRLEAMERLAPDGTVEIPLDAASVLAAADALVAQGVKSVAICFLHAYANPEHEQEAARLIAERHPGLILSLSSDVAPQIREFDRTSTTVANAYVKPLAEKYLNRLSGDLAALGIAAPLFMMLSNGGLTHVDEAKRVPVQLLESGPAAGALSAAFFGGRSGCRDLLAFDLGGTTAPPACASSPKLADWGGDRHGPDFQHIHRNKRGLTLNLKHPQGLATFRMVEQADVVVENYRPDVKGRLGISATRGRPPSTRGSSSAPSPRCLRP